MKKTDFQPTVAGVIHAAELHGKAVEAFEALGAIGRGGQAFQLFGEVRGAARGVLLTADERGWTQMGKKMETGPPSLRFGAAGKMPVLRNGTYILRISFCRFTIFHFRGKTYGKVFGENKISSRISPFLLQTKEILTF